MTEHELKCWPEQFQAMCDGLKPFELRHNDRGFNVGDHLRLHEWEPDGEAFDDDPNAGEYTGRQLVVEVTYMIENCDTFGSLLTDGACVMAVEFIDRVYGENEIPFGYSEGER